MRKHFKSIAAAFMAVMMLMSLFCTPAMAAEQVMSMDNTKEQVLGMDVPMPASTNDIFSMSSVWLTANRVLTYSLYVTEPSRTVQHRLVGKSDSTRGQTVIFSFRNNSTGATRSFTAVADGVWRADSYNTSFPAGNYTLSVTYVGTAGTYGVDVIFLP